MEKRNLLHDNLSASNTNACRDDLHGTALTSKFCISFKSLENLRLSMEFNPILQSYKGPRPSIQLVGFHRLIDK
jgi:hypothetical protein